MKNWKAHIWGIKKSEMKNISGVLVPTDFSPTAWQAVLMGIKVAKASQAPLSLMHITTPTEDQEYLQDINTKLQNISENLSSIYGVEIHSIIAKGDPVVEINQFIEKSDIDFVIMGLNGSGSNEVGSLTNQVLHHLACPVMVVPANKSEPILA